MSVKQVRDVVSRLSHQLAASGADELRNSVAQSTGGLPVYCDLGGCKAVSRTQNVTVKLSRDVTTYLAVPSD